MIALDPERDILAWLAHHEKKELLRFVTVGSVDDGKSTLIGRLLHDTSAVFDDQLAAVKKATAKRAAAGGDPDDIDFSLFTDGLAAEREQGITIDVAYRYFATERRKYILADTPGHVQYTRNMATGASTADVAIILLDARLGVLPQSRRHAFIAGLLGIPELVVAVNKMDLVDYREEVFTRLRDEFGAFTSRLGFARVTFIPISARRGDNVVQRSARTSWFEGATVLEHLETTPVRRGDPAAPLRFPVQYVLRPHLDYRAFAGTVASGAVRPGDIGEVLPSGRRTRVRAVDLFHQELSEAVAPQSVAIRLEDEVDVARGDMIVHAGSAPRVVHRFAADLVWMTERPSDPDRAYLIKHTSRVAPARVERVLSRTDLDTLDALPAPGLGLNDLGRVVIRAARPLFVDAYARSRQTGAFILIDALTNETVAAGMVRDEAPPEDLDLGPSLHPTVTADDRAARLGHRAAVVWVAPAPTREAESRAAAVIDAVERHLAADGVLVASRAGRDDALAEWALGVNAVGGVALVLAMQVRPEARARVREADPAGFVGVGLRGGAGDDVLPLPDEGETASCAVSVLSALEAQGARRCRS